MGYIVNQYKKNFIKRFDIEEAPPELTVAVFPGLHRDEGSFVNSAGVGIRYYTYYYEGYIGDKLILFCHGLGAGHGWYMTQIELLCRKGYHVLAPDFTGCGTSGGEKLSSVNAPARDAMELIGKLNPREQIVLVGHSLGGYTALTVSNLLPNVRKTVIISGFISISDEMMGFVKLRLLADQVKRFEMKLDPKMASVDNHSYLASTADKLLWIHSEDDPVVNYKYNAGWIKKHNNPNVRLITITGKGHFPMFTSEAIGNMNSWMAEYNGLIKEDKLKTHDEKIGFFRERTMARMTDPEPEVFDEIDRFIRS